MQNHHSASLLEHPQKQSTAVVQRYRQPHKGHASLGALLAMTTLTLLINGCDSGQPDGGNTAKPSATTTPGAEQGGPSWQDVVAARRAEIAKVISEDPAGHSAYDNTSLGNATQDMIPYIVFRVLGEIEPDVFGRDALRSYGFFERPEIVSGLNGVIWTPPITPIKAEIGDFKLRYFTRTCSSCHSGRVRLENGETHLVEGSSNTEFRMHTFVGRQTAAFKARLGASNADPNYQAFKQAIITAVEAKDPAWFWGEGAELSAEEMSAEVTTLLANLDAVLGQMRAMNSHRLNTLGLLQKYGYDKATNPPSLTDGAPGMVETAGLGSAGLIPIVGEDKAGMILPPSPSMADIPAVWALDPTGYANWDGTVKGFSRALTSSLAVVGDLGKIDMQVNKDIQRFLGELPAAPYPFDLDMAAIKRGDAIFNKECLVCHQPAAGRAREDMVFDVQTDPARSMATSAIAANILQQAVSSACPQDQQCVIGDPTKKRGYVASSLAGTWMQAPYLHNGSVPTLRQLLVPSLRTNEPFLRGSTSYDTINGGWEWQPGKLEELRKQDDLALSLHDIRQSGFGNHGHGSDEQPNVTVNGKQYRISWTDSAADKQVVDDLIAYLLSL